MAIAIVSVGCKLAKINTWLSLLLVKILCNYIYFRKSTPASDTDCAAVATTMNILQVTSLLIYW